MLMIIKFVFTIGIHLVENVPRWIGGVAASLGESGRAETSSNTAVVAIANLKISLAGNRRAECSAAVVEQQKNRPTAKNPTDNRQRIHLVARP